MPTADGVHLGWPHTTPTDWFIAGDDEAATDRRSTSMDDRKYRTDVAHAAMGHGRAPTLGVALTAARS